MNSMKKAKLKLVGARQPGVLGALQDFEYDPYGEEECVYIDAATERDFRVRRVTSGDGTPGFHLIEASPSGMLMQYRGDVFLGAREVPELLEFEANPGPNGFRAACRAAGIDLDLVSFNLPGFSIDSRYLPSLEACAEAIEQALATNQRYCAYRELAEEEKAALAHRDAVESAKFWVKQEAVAAAAETKSEGLFKGCHDMLGRPLDEEARKAILSYLNCPSQDEWLSIRGKIIAGMVTLWQAWCAADADAPRSGNDGFPDAEILRGAIRAAVDRNKSRIQGKIAEKGRPGLRRC